MSDLKPCPFCGGEGIIYQPPFNKREGHDSDARPDPIVKCMDCYAEVCGHDVDSSGESSKLAWNLRFEEDRLKAQNADLLEALKEINSISKMHWRIGVAPKLSRTALFDIYEKSEGLLQAARESHE